MYIYKLHICIVCNNKYPTIDYFQWDIHCDQLSNNNDVVDTVCLRTIEMRIYISYIFKSVLDGSLSIALCLWLGVVLELNYYHYYHYDVAKKFQ